jgi:hypothetical protein
MTDRTHHRAPTARVDGTHAGTAPARQGPPAAHQAGPVPPERRSLLVALVGRAATPGTRSLLVGEPGTGRSLLLDLAVRGARDAGVFVLETRAAGTADRPFSGLADLLQAVPERHLRALPSQQRAAVATVLVRRGEDLESGDDLRAGVAALVRALQRESPVCLAVDDWPQLDHESATVVRGVLDPFPAPREGRSPSLLATQRLEEVLTGVRDRIDPLAFGPQDVLPVPSLTVGSLAAVVTARTGQRWDGAAAAELHRATGGNPRWAAEIAGQQLAHLPGSVGVQLPASVDRAVRTRVLAAPERARYALAVVAVLGSADPEVVLAAVPDHQVALVEAFDARLLRWSAGRLEPVHPVLGTAALALLGHRRTEQLRRELSGRRPR